ncbi:MAG: outer membrane beta-barrel protein [Cellulophaga sp.]
MKKKNIDHLFQEKFKSLQETPDEKVWAGISISLDKKKKNRKIIPVWWKLGGIAAALALLFFVINSFEETSVPNNAVTNTEPTELPSTNEKNEAIDKVLFNTPNSTKEKATIVTNEDNLINTSEPNTTNNNPITLLKKQNTVFKKAVNNGNQIAISNRKTIPATTNKDEARQNYFSKNKAVALNNTTQNEEKERVSEQKNKNGKKSIFDEIEKAEEEKEVIAENNQKSWSVGPSIAPVYFNGAGEGSPIHSSFASNSKSGNVNLSYGVFVSYEVSNRLSIRSGLHKVNYGYNTNEISFSSSFEDNPNRSLIENIDYAISAENIILESNTKSIPSSEKFSDAITEVPTKNGRMVQQFGYLEVPIELNYALVNKRLGVNIIGGFSSLFLIDNSITLDSKGLTVDLGEAKNINTLNFSTNIGLGLNYKVTPKLQLKVEPIFKYQLDTFSDASGNFKPFSIGVYSGFSFKF